VSATHGGTRFRHGPWHESATTAQVVPIGGGTVDHAAVAEISNLILGLGFHRILTAALVPHDQAPFLEFGYQVHEPLRLLELNLDPNRIGRSTRPTRRMRRRDVAASLAIDAASFTSFWQFDADALDEAISATPTSRRRVVRSDRVVLGYAITGHTGRTGFIQRLAVDPDSRRAGVGGTLLTDGLAWLHTRGVEGVLVNTQPENEAALALYDRFGFVERPGGLAVLCLEVPPPRLRSAHSKETP
jgi:GNAT superfamily N-acetyltransferase